MDGNEDEPRLRHYETPSREVVAQEERDRMQMEFDEILHNVPLHQRQILLLLRQGLTHVEIAKRLNTCEKTVRRLIRRIAAKKVIHEQ